MLSHMSLFTPEIYSISGRLRIAAILDDEKSSQSFIGKKVEVAGWVRTIRQQCGGKLLFVVLSDGSTSNNLQIVVEDSVKGFEAASKAGTGCSVRVLGKVVESPAKCQLVELLLKDEDDEIIVVGSCDQAKYPLAKKQHTKEFLRDIAHLRPRTQFFGAITRIRNALAIATHSFFQSKGFYYVHTPIITSADCEGAGELFQVSTLQPATGKISDIPQENGLISYEKDFFGKSSFLTVSGQLALENFACGMCDVYTFGPTFRAENSHTSRHLAEFWMIEPEIAFADILVNMKCAEEYLKYCIDWCFKNNMSDLEYFESSQEEGLMERLRNVLAESFERITYTEVIDILKSHQSEFSQKVEWGMDLPSEMEKYLTEKITKKPTIVYNYPKDIKSFYMKLNDDGKTVAAMDILVPKIGEIIGGSQREDDYDRLESAMEKKEMCQEPYWWYKDLRKYGTVPHAGFGLGFERLIMMVTGIDNIRDSIPFPRYPGHANF